MRTRPHLRKLVLTAHVVSSVGWLGAVAVFLVLGIVGLTSADGRLVRAVHLAMQSAGWTVLVPLALASLVTGLVQSLGTKWGLFRHYWILIKFAINIVAIVILLLYTQTLDYLAETAAQTTPGSVDALREPSPVVHAALGMLLLLVAATLSVYKPRGMTRYGQRKQHRERTALGMAGAASPLRPIAPGPGCRPTRALHSRRAEPREVGWGKFAAALRFAARDSGFRCSVSIALLARMAATQRPPSAHPPRTSVGSWTPR